MNMKHNREDWLDKICTSLAESTEVPPVGGWARLERDLLAQQPSKMALFPRWARSVAAVAAVVVCFVSGGILFLNGDATTEITVGEQQLIGGINNIVEADGAIEVDASTKYLIEKIVAEQIESSKLSSNVIKVAQNSTSIKKSISTQNIGVAAQNIDKKSKFKTENHTYQKQEPEVVAVLGNVDGEAFVMENDATKNRETAPRQFAALPAQPQHDLYAHDENLKSKKAGRFGFSASVGGGFSQSASSATNLLAVDAPPIINSTGIVALSRSYDNYTYNHKQSFSFGLMARKEFSHGLSLETGVVYSLLRSDVIIAEDSDPLKQSLHYLGIPLSLNWSFVNRSDFSVYAGVGGMGERSLSAKFDSSYVSEKEFQWSVFGTLGAQYNINKYASIYFEPKLSHYLTETTLRTIRTASNVMLTLQFGVRFTY